MIRFRAGHGSIGVDDPALHPVLRLLAGSITEPDDRERGKIGRDEVGFDVDAPRFEADDGGGDGSGDHTSDAMAEPVTCPSRLCAESETIAPRSASDGDEDRLVVLPGSATRAPVDMPLVAVDEPQPRTLEDLGVEIAPIVDDDADAASERERQPGVLEHRCDTVDVFLDCRPAGAPRRSPELEIVTLGRFRAARRRTDAARGSRSGRDREAR